MWRACVRAIVWAVVAASAFQVGAASAGGRAPTKSVFEILENVERYRGKLVVVRGWLGINWRHGVTYIGQNEENGEACRGFTKELVEWPSEILLTWPEDGPADGPVSFKAAPGEVWKKLWYHVKGAEVGITVKAVIEGELRSRPGIVIHRRDGARPLGNGYGRYGNFPAELVIKRIIKIEPPIKVY